MDPSPELDRLVGRSILAVSDLRPDEVGALFSLAASLEREPVHSKPLENLVVLTAFFEPSTRTRLSFESAAQRLGANVLTIPEAGVAGDGKGESLADMGRMFDAYADIVVVRHPRDTAMDDVRACGMSVPLINAGNGSDAHPTQALVDWYAMTKHLRGEACHVGVIGTPHRMRSVRSFMLMGATCFPHLLSRVTVVSEEHSPVDDETQVAMKAAGVPLEVAHDLESCVSSFDVIYINSLALTSDGYRPVNTGYKLDTGTPLKPGSVVLHPLARGAELDTSLDDTDHNLYFDQAAGAVYVRQALLLAVAGRLP